MAATLHRLRTRVDRLNEGTAEKLRQLVLEFGEQEGLSDRAVGPLVREIDQRTAAKERWRFIMISHAQFDAVADWVEANSKRPRVASRFWRKLLGHVRMDTGEVVASRDELAAEVGIAPVNLSRIVTELVGINALMRRRDGRCVRYFVNPNVATHLGGIARERAQAAAGPVQLDLV